MTDPSTGIINRGRTASRIGIGIAIIQRLRLIHVSFVINECSEADLKKGVLREIVIIPRTFWPELAVCGHFKRRSGTNAKRDKVTV